MLGCPHMNSMNRAQPKVVVVGAYNADLRVSCETPLVQERVSRVARCRFSVEVEGQTARLPPPGPNATCRLLAPVAEMGLGKWLKDNLPVSGLTSITSSKCRSPTLGQR